MGTATYGGEAFKERTRVSAERPIGAASFRQQSMQASAPPPPTPSPPLSRNRRKDVHHRTLRAFCSTTVTSAANCQVINTEGRFCDGSGVCYHCYPISFEGCTHTHVYTFTSRIRCVYVHVYTGRHALVHG